MKKVQLSDQTKEAFAKFIQEAEAISRFKKYYRLNGIRKIKTLGFSMIEINTLTKEFNFKEYIKKKDRDKV